SSNRISYSLFFSRSLYMLRWRTGHGTRKDSWRSSGFLTSQEEPSCICQLDSLHLLHPCISATRMIRKPRLHPQTFPSYCWVQASSGSVGSALTAEVRWARHRLQLLLSQPRIPLRPPLVFA